VEQSTLTAVQKSAEGIVGGMKQALIFESMDELGTRPVYRKSRCRKLSTYTEEDFDVMSPLKAGTVRESK
jgi:hypothetical protein